MNEITVVLIEDHDLTRFGLKTALQQQGNIKIIGESTNGIEGLKILELVKPDIAVVDIGLPEIDGIEVTRRFKKSLTELNDSELQKTKFLMLTMQDNENSVLAAFAAGADSYCMKDISQDQLLEALRVTNEGNSWIDPAIASVILKQARQASSTLKGSNTAPVKVLIKGTDTEQSNLIEGYPLSVREREVLELIVAGYSNAAIGENLYITVGTVKTHVRNILNKLCVDDRTQAAVRALRAGLVG